MLCGQAPFLLSGAAAGKQQRKHRAFARCRLHCCFETTLRFECQASIAVRMHRAAARLLRRPLLHRRRRRIRRSVQLFATLCLHASAAVAASRAALHAALWLRQSALWCSLLQ